MKDSIFRIAVAGLGFGDKVHIPAIHANKEIELAGIWHPRDDRLAEVAKKQKVKGYKSWDSLISDSSIDGIIIATPPEPRFQLALEARSVLPTRQLVDFKEYNVLVAWSRRATSQFYTRISNGWEKVTRPVFVVYGKESALSTL